MSRRRELEQRLKKLGEIGEIMRSMKNLALMETRKLARFLEAQYESVRLIEAVAADFLHHYPRFTSNAAPDQQAVLAIGSERGFCGDFNEELQKQLSTEVPIFAVGGKLCARLEKHASLAGQFSGPSIAEDVSAILNRLVQAIGQLQHAQDCPGLTVIHHRSGAEGLTHKSLLPPFIQTPQRPTDHLHAPLLNLSPEQFFAELVRHYLFAALHEIFFTSLMAENQRRIQHLEGAIQKLEEKNEVLARQSRTLRQEEITEEIEVILLGVEQKF